MEEEKVTLSSVRERLQSFIDSRGITDREFCRRIGVSPAYVTSMRKSVSPAVMERISSVYPMLNPEWLLAGNGEMLLNVQKEELRKPGELLPSEKLDVILEEIRNEKARLQEANYNLIEIVKKQQETITELSLELKKANARTVEDATCAAVG